MSGCKVERVSESYGIPLTERLREAHERGVSLRRLEEMAGIELLRSRMDEEGVEYVEGDPARYYRVLTSEEGTSVAREEVRRKLSRDGIDVDEVLDAVPSYQTVRFHLQDCEERDTSGTKSNERDLEDVSGTVRATEARVERVVEGAAARMGVSVESVNTGTIVKCGECRSVVGVHEFLDGGCGCVERD